MDLDGRSNDDLGESLVMPWHLRASSVFSVAPWWMAVAQRHAGRPVPAPQQWPFPPTGLVLNRREGRGREAPERFRSGGGRAGGGRAVVEPPCSCRPWVPRRRP